MSSSSRKRRSPGGIAAERSPVVASSGGGGESGGDGSPSGASSVAVVPGGDGPRTGTPRRGGGDAAASDGDSPRAAEVLAAVLAERDGDALDAAFAARATPPAVAEGDSPAPPLPPPGSAPRSGATNGTTGATTERVGDLPPKPPPRPGGHRASPHATSGPRYSMEPSPPPLPHGGPRDGSSPRLSKYRELSREERRRLLKEVKAALGEESLMSGDPGRSPGSVSYEEEDSSEFLRGDDGSGSEDDDDCGTRGTAETRETDTAFFTEDSTTRYTADAQSAFLSSHTFDTEDTRPRYQKAHRGRGDHNRSGSGGGRGRSSRGRDLDHSLLEEVIEEEDGDGIFGLADSCAVAMDYLCGSGDAQKQQSRSRSRGRERQRDGEDDRDGRRGRDDETASGDGETATAEWSAASRDESFSWSRPKHGGGLTVKDRLAKLEEELITGKPSKKGKKKSKRDGEDEEEGEAKGGVEGSPSKLHGGVEATESAFLNSKRDGEEGEGDRSSRVRDDPSGKRCSPGPSMLAGEVDAASGRRLAGAPSNTSEVGAEVPLAEAADLTRPPSLRITLSYRDRSKDGSLTEESTTLEENKEGGTVGAGNNGAGEAPPEAARPPPTDEAKGAVDPPAAPPAPKPKRPSPFVRAVSFTSKSRSSKDKRSASPFVRVVSSISTSRQKSKLDTIDGGSSGTKKGKGKKDKQAPSAVVQDDSTCSVKTEPSNGSKTNPSDEETASKESGGATGHKSAAGRGKRRWREFVDPLTGNKYFSDGRITTWNRPPSADVVTVAAPAPAADKAAPRSGASSPATPVASNKSAGTPSKKPSTPPWAGKGGKGTSAASSPSTPPPKGSKDRGASNAVGGKDKGSVVDGSPRKSKKFKLFFKYKNKKRSGATPTKGSGSDDANPAASPDRTEAGSAEGGSGSPAPSSPSNSGGVEHTPLATVVVGDEPHPDSSFETNGTSEESPKSAKSAGSGGKPALVQAQATMTTAMTTPKKKKKKQRGWREYADPSTGKKYYSNGTTTTWDKPADFGEGGGDAPTTPAKGSDGAKASPKTSATPALAKSVPKESDHSQKTEKHQNARVKRGKGGWKEYLDGTTGKRYYSDGVTTTWVRPAAFDGP